MTPEEKYAQAALKAADTDMLLQRFAGLTHRIHKVEAEPVKNGFEKSQQRERAADLRAQRDLIKIEILTRTGDIK